MLIYLSGHGVLDAEGKPCLVLATDRGVNSWQPQLSRLEDFPTLDLQKTLDTIADCYAGQSGVKKVVLLDCSRIHVNPELGILENRFDEALAGLRLKDDMFVLSSAGSAQLGWTLPDRRASAFGFYVCKGLAGRADEKQFGGNEDGVVTLDELERYVRKQVNEQVQARSWSNNRPCCCLKIRRTARPRLHWRGPIPTHQKTTANRRPRRCPGPRSMRCGLVMPRLGRAAPFRLPIGRKNGAGAMA